MTLLRLYTSSDCRSLYLVSLNDTHARVSRLSHFLVALASVRDSRFVYPWRSRHPLSLHRNAIRASELISYRSTTVVGSLYQTHVRRSRACNVRWLAFILSVCACLFMYIPSMRHLLLAMCWLGGVLECIWSPCMSPYRLKAVRLG